MKVSGCAESVQDDGYGGKTELMNKPGLTALEDNWLSAYKNSLKDVEELSEYVMLSPEEKQALKPVASLYNMRIPHYYLSLVRELQNPHDPVRRQCLPSLEEIREVEIENIDPLGEERTSPTQCLVHRYPDRALLIVTGRCFMYCRHCTRKRLWKQKIGDTSLRDIDKAVSYLRKQRGIREVVVSGGDPLTLATERLDYIISALAQLKNIEVIRIGTRAPVVLPQRVDASLCSMLSKYDNLWINVQFNHPWEVTPQAASACNKLQKCGIPISNQSVLLKGINDNAQVMKELCHKLQAIRVRPYYLFECDPVVGTSHFRTPVSDGIEIIKKMRGHTSGMCVPTFVVDGVDGKGKVPVAHNYLVSESEEGVLLKNYEDRVFFYHNPVTEVKPAKSSSSVRKIGLVFNLKKNHDGSDAEEEYDEIETIESISREISNLGFAVHLYEQGKDLPERLRKDRPDFVLNIAEGKGAGRARESQVPAILESLNIPYTGSDPVALGITLDKYLTSTMLRAANVPVPQMFMVKDKSELSGLSDIFKKNKSFIVKPRWEGSSKGIFNNSVVDNFKDLEARVLQVLGNYSQPALVEEFIEGDEITAGVCGNDQPRLLGMMKIVPVDKTQKRFVYSLEVKRDWKKMVAYEPEESIAEPVRKAVEQYALAAYRALELKDFSRVDFRIGKDNIPQIIDINPLPGLSPNYSDLPILYRLKNSTYADLIATLLKGSFARHGLEWSAQV